MKSIIIFEGPDGVGKSTQLRLLNNYFEESNFSTRCFSFPGQKDGSLGKFVYDIHHNMHSYNIQEINPASLQILHLAAHIDLLEREIIPALKEFEYILLDRYWWSLWVYGQLNGVSLEFLERIIDVENYKWNKIPKPVIINLVSSAPFSKHEHGDNWSQIANLYKKLAARESKNSVVLNIECADTAKKTSADILEKIRGLEL